MKIITWNINSVRIREVQIKKLIEIYNPDLLCLQETKVTNNSFPTKNLEKLGFKYFYLNGIPSYNGVCILSKNPATKIEKIKWCNLNDGRHIKITVNKINLHSLYIPAGGDEPDPSINEKFKHKLRFIDELFSWSSKEKPKNCVICGDFNIAPREVDVWNHNQLKNVVSHTQIEREKLLNFKSSNNWYDTIESKNKECKNLFTWWSYRSRDYKISNRGRRLDHIWVSNNLINKIKQVKILKETRSWERPSDHVPIILELDI